MATLDVVPRAGHEGGVGTTAKPWLELHADALFATRATNDQPGAGTNVCPAGGCYLWRELATGRTYLVSNYSGTYSLVELGDQ